MDGQEWCRLHSGGLFTGPKRRPKGAHGSPKATEGGRKRGPRRKDCLVPKEAARTNMKTEKALHKTAERPPDPNAILGPDGKTLMLPGAVCVQWRRCGKPTCRCAREGEPPHGPYFVRCYRYSGGRQVRRYVKPADVEATRAACAEWQRLQSYLRENRRRNALALRLMTRYVRGVEHRGNA